VKGIKTYLPTQCILFLTTKTDTLKETGMQIEIQDTTERIESTGGLLLAGKIIRRIGLTTLKHGIIGNGRDVIISIFGLLVQGRTKYEDMNLFRGNEFFRNAFGLHSTYAVETIRLYLEKLAETKEAIMRQLRECNARLLKKAKLTSLWVNKKEYLPVDIDTSPMDNSKSKKEGVSRTYKEFDGYHPIFAYIGREGYMLDSELRPGSQHCQKGTPEFIQRLQEHLNSLKLKKRFLFRLDGGNDSVETIHSILKKPDSGERTGYFLIIKRNRRRESPAEWLKIAQEEGKASMPREGKTVWTGVTAIHPPSEEWIPEVSCAFEVIERETDREGTPYLIPEIEVNTWWTNLDADAETVINLYHDHGTSEQFHSELKTDIGLERFPSGKMAVNELILTIAMVAFNVLRFIGQAAIKEREYLPYKTSVHRKRLGKVIRDVILIPGKLVFHAGKLIFRVSQYNPWLPVLKRLYFAFDTW